MEMKAQRIQGIDYYDPYYHVYEVYFGYPHDSNRGVLAFLENEIQISAWLQADGLKHITVEGCRVLFSERDDAERCFRAFS